VLAAVGGLLGASLAGIPADAAASGKLSISNPDVLPGSHSVVLSSIKYKAENSQGTHRTVALVVRNSGKASLTVTSLSATGPFTLTSASARPFVLKKGESTTVTATFTATTGTKDGQWRSGTGSIRWTSAGNKHREAIKLSGWYQKYSEHNLEPSLSTLVHRFGYKSKMPADAHKGAAQYKKFSKDEVLSSYWTRYSKKKSARLTQLGAFHTYPSGVVVSKYSKADKNTISQIFSGHVKDSQTVLPRRVDGQRGTATFTNTKAFGFKIDSEYSDHRLNDAKVDKAHGCVGTCGQHVRFFKVRNAAGNVKKGKYIMTMDFSGVNYDFNDNVFLLENVKPA
jgi:hypothetical protein